MEMIIPNHSICYFYYDFSVFVFIILFGSIRKIMSYRFILFAFNLIDHQYSICRMYLEENSQVFRFLVSYLLSLRVSNAVFECRSCISSVALSLVNKGGRYPILHVEISVRIVGVYGIGCNTFYPHIHQLLLEISL